MTSNCSCPTVPMIRRLLNWLTNICATPSFMSCSTPFWNCFDFIGSSFSIYLNSSGENDGKPRKCRCSPSVSVSPILNMPLSGRPTMSPGHASSTVLLRWAMNCVGEEKRVVLSSLTW